MSRTHKLIYKKTNRANDVRAYLDTDKSVSLIMLCQTLGDDKPKENVIILEKSELEEILNRIKEGETING